jgi:hypothetical protein
MANTTITLFKPNGEELKLMPSHWTVGEHGVLTVTTTLPGKGVTVFSTTLPFLVERTE